MSRPPAWGLVHLRHGLLGCLTLVVVAILIDGSAWTPQAHAATTTQSAVRHVQTRLAELKFLAPSRIDGRLGPQTKDAITAFQQWHGLVADGIAGPRTLDKLRTSTAPRPGHNAPPRRLEVYRAKGITLLVDNGRVKRAIHSSAGKRGYDTPRGTYRIQRKVLKDWSRPYKTWMPYASYFHGGYALHEGTVPPYLASHGCVRLPPWEAAAVYRFATIGTMVVVY